GPRLARSGLYDALPPRLAGDGPGTSRRDECRGGTAQRPRPRRARSLPPRCPWVGRSARANPAGVASGTRPSVRRHPRAPGRDGEGEPGTRSRSWVVPHLAAVHSGDRTERRPPGVALAELAILAPAAAEAEIMI